MEHGHQIEFANLPQAAALRIVMVGTTHPGNIGAAARAMKNMGLSELVLVAPKRFPDEEATSRASSAVEILEQASVVETVAQAVADCHWVVGASARLRTAQWPQVAPREMAAHAISRVRSGETLAILFGRESSGLSNDELEYCQQLMHIPTNPDYSSLNVAAAIQLVCYELRIATLDQQTREQFNRQVCNSAEPAEPAATSAELEHFFAHAERVATEIGMLNPDNPRYLMRRLRQLVHRLQPNKTELNLLRGWLSATQKPKR